MTECAIVAEVGQAHDGSLGMAHAYIEATAKTGADAVKFQTHIAAEESTPEEPWRVKFSRQDATRYDYWRRMEFTEDQWQGLREHAHDVGLRFISSPFSLQAVELLSRVGVDAYKVASGEVSNVPLLEAVTQTGRPVVLSSGMSTIAELDKAVELVTEGRNNLTVLQCTSAYPCPPEKVGLNVIPILRERYGCSVGLSDHSGTIFAGLAAAAFGIEMLEVHITMSRELFGPDVPASVTPAELAQLVEGIRFIERAVANPVDKDSIAIEMQPLRDLFTKSVVAARDLCEGTILRADDLTVKKPGTGMPAEQLPKLVGGCLMRDVQADEQLSEGDVEDQA